MALLEEYQKCNKKGEDQPSVEILPTLSRPRTGWCPPPSGFIKFNWDASINVTKKCIGIGIGTGNVLGAKSLTKKVVVCQSWQRL
jgi:hypothetical protein